MALVCPPCGLHAVDVWAMNALVSAVSRPKVERIDVMTFLSCCLAAAGGAVLSSFVLTRGNRILQSPFHHDDYDMLTMSLETFGMPAVRPVSRFAMAALADLGAGSLYLALFCLVVLYVVLCAIFVSRWLGVARSGRALVRLCFVVALVAFWYERAPESVRYTGHITNAISGSLGMLAASLALSACRGSIGAVLAAALTFGLSLYAKEDYAPFVLLVLSIGVGEAIRRRDRRCIALSVGLLATAGLLVVSLLVYNHLSIQSPFLAGQGAYAAKFSLRDLGESARYYALVTPFGATLLGVLVGAILLVRWRRRDLFPRLLLLCASIAALVLPYTPLVQHRFELYACNWIPLMVATTVVCWEATRTVLLSARSRAALRACGFVVLLVLYGVSTPGREALARQITSAQDRNRAIVAQVLRHRAALRGHAEIVVSGLDGVKQPWTWTNASFVNRRLGHDVFWFVLADPDSFLSRLHRDYQRSLVTDRVAVVPLDCAAVLRDLPRLHFDATYAAKLISPSRGRTQTSPRPIWNGSDLVEHPCLAGSESAARPASIRSGDLRRAICSGRAGRDPERRGQDVRHGRSG